MTSRLDITAPATISVLAGNGTLSSLGALPPGGISVTDSDTTGTIAVQLIAGNAGAALSASGLGGATVSSDGATLSLTGTESEINAALASLELIEPGTATQDVLTLTASDPAVLPAQTNILVDVAPTTGPAFVDPALIVTLQPNALDAMPDLFLSDPEASALVAMGLGREDTLNLTLSVASGILMLPGYSNFSGITATGLGTGTIELSFTADDIAALNTLLAGLEFAGAAGGEHLNYTLRNVSGVLPTALTFGNIFLNIAGTAGTDGTLTTGSQTVVLGGDTLGGTATITGTTAVLGNISGAGSVVVTPDANLELPYNALFLGGTSLDYGTIGATTLVEAGTLIVADGADFAGEMLLGTSALLDFTGMLVADGAETEDYQEAISLAAGAVLTGSGILEAGNFSESGLITGPGTILAEGGETLLISAGSVGGGTHLEVAAGGVMVLGPVTPLFGVFDATPLTIDSSVTLSFLGNAGDVGITGGYAGTLGGAGGAFVINGPQAFSGTIIGFEAGDQLIFPGLSDFSVFNITQGSFTVAGLNASGSTVSYIFHAQIPTGTGFAVGFDAEGDPDIELRPAAATITQDVLLEASAGIAQPLQGLNLQLTTGTTQSLKLVLSVSHGIISGDGIAAGATITLTASNLSALNAELAALTYTGTGANDAVTFSSTTGPLSGLLDFALINAAPSGTVSGYSGTGFSEAQTASFGSTSGLSIITNPIAPGEIVVDDIAEFADALQVNGLSSTALLVDGGGSAIFDAAALVALDANVTVGDENGAGTLAIITDAFSSTGNLTLAAEANAAGSAVYVLGALSLAGTLNVGEAAAATFDLDGYLSVAASSLGDSGTIFAYGGATANFGAVDNTGTMILDGATQARSSAVMQSGALILGGTSSLNVSGLMNLEAGSTLQIGTDAVLDAGTILQAGQGILDDGTLVVATTYIADAPIQLSGGTIEAPSLTLESAGLLVGYGSVDAGTIQSDGIIEAVGGVLTLSGSISNSATIEIRASAALDLAGGLTSGPEIAFLGSDAVLTVDDPSRFSAGARNMVGTDAIDLVGEAPGLVSYASGIVTIYDNLDNVLSTFSLAVAAGQPGLSIISDGHGGALITLDDELPCFARGTRLLTPHGYRAVETLKPGDPLITASGGKHPVCWIGRRTLDLGPSTAWAALPVLIMPDAFGPGLPARPLRLSPLHCVYADGVLVPVTHLVNGATIIRETGQTALTYFHVELDQHDILLAEGLPCESYLDTGNRGALYHELGQRSPAKHAFAPNVTTGAKLAAIRRRLHVNALAAGFSLTYWPHLRAVASGQTVPPEITKAGSQRLARFTFPAPAKDITLLSGVASPADTDPDSEDRRELGVCLEPSAKVRLGQGWYARAPEDAGVWMGRVSSLHLDQAVTEFQLPLVAITQSWVKPVVDARPRPA